jgi:hypothetical protein
MKAQAPPSQAYVLNASTGSGNEQPYAVSFKAAMGFDLSQALY